MSCEFALSFPDIDDLSDRYIRFESSQPLSATNYREAIFSPPAGFYQIQKTIQLKNQWSSRESETIAIARRHCIAPLGTISGEVGASISWGGENGTQVSGYASGSATDDNGNKVDITVEVKSDGSGNASASTSHQEKTNS